MWRTEKSSATSATAAATRTETAVTSARRVSIRRSSSTAMSSAAATLIRPVTAVPRSMPNTGSTMNGHDRPPMSAPR